MTWPRPVSALLAGLGLLAPSYAQVALRLDTAFHAQLPADSWVHGILPLDDGKIILSGGGYGPYFQHLNWIERFFPNGDADPTFAEDARGYGDLLPWGDKFYAIRSGLRRFMPDGQVDTTFSTIVAGVCDYTMLDDGKLILCSTSGDLDVAGLPSYAVLKVDTNGTPDPDFNYGGLGHGPVSGVFKLANGHIYLTGGWQIGPNAGKYLLRIDELGNVDPAFELDAAVGQFSLIRDMELQADGKLIVVGRFLSNNGQPVRNLLRLHPDGSIDPSFGGQHTWSFEGYCNENLPWMEAHLLPAGHVLVSGRFDQVDGEPRHGLAVLDPQGELTSVGSSIQFEPFIEPPNPDLHLLGFSNVIALDNERLLCAGSFHGVVDGSTSDTDAWSVCALRVQDLGLFGVEPDVTIDESIVADIPILSTSQSGTPVRVELYNAHGQLVTVKQAFTSTSRLGLPFDVSGIPPGMYTALFVGADGPTRMKIVVAH